MQLDRALLKASWQSWISSSLERSGPYWLQWVWTLLFCAALALFFTVLGFLTYARESMGAWRNLLGWGEWYLRNLVVTLCIGSVIHLLFDACRNTFATPAALRRWSGWQRTLFFSGVPLLGTLVGWPTGIWLAGGPIRDWSLGPGAANTIVGVVLLSMLLTFVFHQFFAMKTRELSAERRATEAQLRLLQGQIEPHFLFNTLANVQALMDHDPPKARAMLEAFTDYLRGSLTQLRREDSAVGMELDLAEAYLRLLQGRMDDRLRFSISADDAARRVTLPPLLLQPLVENAVVHGLEPQLDGGTVQVRARVEGGQLVLEVHDDGRGPDAPARPGSRAGNGLALKNIRERLLSRYGHRASLQVRAAQPGTLVTLTLPLDDQPSRA
jgi:two-component sensor histidine kinase